MTVISFLLSCDAPTTHTGSVTPKILPSGFRDDVVFSGLFAPTIVRFASDGRIFVAEQRGVVKVFDSLSATTPTVVADFQTETIDYWDRGLLGMALDPNFPASPYVYLLYAYDSPLGGTAPFWNDSCPTPPGPNTDGCPVTGRLVRITLSGNVMVGSPQVLISNEWCQQYPSHSIGDLLFGPDGALYATAGEGASFTFEDYGQGGGSAGSPTPRNPCGDPPAGVGGVEAPPTAEGGALRSQSLRRPAGEPVVLNGSLLRLDPTTGAGLPSNPGAGSASANARRIIAYGMRNPFRFTFRPGTSEIWIGDVGEGRWEEVDRRVSPTGPVQNFGWPCYEGAFPQPAYQSIGLNSCTSLYNTPGGVTAPYWAYNHTDEIVPGDGCDPAIGSAITAIAFYGSGSYPAAYNGALFFGDYSRRCIWAMLPGANGLPDPTQIRNFVSGGVAPVDLQAGPGGDLFYVDYSGGTIHRISYMNQPPPPPSTCPNDVFRAQYFNNATLGGAPVLDRCEPSVNYDWGAGGPGSGVSNDNFSARWSGNFNLVAGTYTFTARADDGIRVYVDGTLVIDAWVDQGATTYQATRAVAAGLHAITVEYYERAGQAVAQVGWTVQNVPCAASGVFHAQYFNNQTLTGTPVLDRCENNISYEWGAGGPGNGVGNDNFSARWTGSFNFAAGTYAFTATADDGIRVYVDGTLVIDAWVDQAATTYQGARTLTAGAHSIVVEYYENAGQAVAQVTWAQVGGTNQPPVPVIDTPAPTLRWRVGDPIAFSGHATDPEQGTLPASALTWTFILHHCTTPNDCHTHTIQTLPGIAGGTLNAPDHDYPSWLELQLMATDAAGQSATASIRLDPITVDLTFATVPSGLTLAVGGSVSVTPFVRTVIVNSATSISAPSTQTLSGTSYGFSSWSDGGAATHNITAGATPTTYTATYTSQGTGPCPNGVFRAQYFNNQTLTGAPAIDRCESSINDDWGAGGPGNGVGINNFSARWTGTFNFPAGDTIFTARADDGIRVYVDGTLVINAWVDQGATTYQAVRTLTAGAHTIVVEYYENAGLAVAQVSWAPAGVACQASGVFRAQYFNNTTLTGTPVLDRCEASIDDLWGAGGPGNGVPNDNFSARWSGSFNFAAGSYIFTARADDGIRVYVDGVLIIDAWIDQAATTYQATRTLTAGAHTIVVEYYERGGLAVAQVSWAAGP